MSMRLQEQSVQAINYCFLMCDFLLLNADFDLSQRVREAKLLDRRRLEKFKARVKELEVGDDLAMDVEECILYITVFDLAGKCFVSNVMDEMRAYFTAAFGLSDPEFVQFRSFFLQLSAALTAPVREHLQGVPEFRNAMQRLDTLPFSTD